MEGTITTKLFPTRTSDYAAWISSLEGVAVGDVFLVHVSGWERNALEKVTCSKVTATQAVIGSKRYRIKDGKELGGYGALRNYTAEAWREEQLARKRGHVLVALKNFNWRTLSDSELLAVSVIIKPYLEKKEQTA